MEIKIKTSSLFQQCDLSFHASLTDFADIVKSSTNAAQITVRCGLEKVSVKSINENPIHLVLEKTNFKILKSLVGIFFTNEPLCPVESLNIFSDESLTTVWSETF